MKALSIKQPWAWLIAAGHKDIENRSWHTNFRGKFLIHASKILDDEGLFILSNELFDEYDRTPVTFGAIIGEAEIVDCVTESDSPWFENVEGNKGFVIINAKLFDMPIPYKGQLKFFEIDLLNLKMCK